MIRGRPVRSPAPPDLRRQAIDSPAVAHYEPPLSLAGWAPSGGSYLPTSGGADPGPCRRRHRRWRQPIGTDLYPRGEQVPVPAGGTGAVDSQLDGAGARRRRRVDAPLFDDSLGCSSFANVRVQQLRLRRDRFDFRAPVQVVEDSLTWAACIGGRPRGKRIGDRPADSLGLGYSADRSLLAFEAPSRGESSQRLFSGGGADLGPELDAGSGPAS